MAAFLFALVLSLSGRAGGDGDLLIELRRADLQRMCNGNHVFKRDHAVAAFNASDVMPLEVTHVRELLL